MLSHGPVGADFETEYPSGRNLNRLVDDFINRGVHIFIEEGLPGIQRAIALLTYVLEMADQGEVRLPDRAGINSLVKVLRGEEGRLERKWMDSILVFSDDFAAELKGTNE